jgi:hypothetical protein
LQYRTDDEDLGLVIPDGKRSGDQQDGTAIVAARCTTRVNGSSLTRLTIPQ